MNKRAFVITACLLFFAAGYAQRSFVLWDKVNDIPVSKASIYTICHGKVKSTFSNQQGHADIDFAFDSLTVSHINYHKICVKTLSDTLFMEQTIQILSEIVVSPASEPAWIKPMLEDFVKTKEDRYKNNVMLRYDYQTQNISDTVLYRFVSKGLVRKKKLFEVHPMESIITFKDLTAGCDYSNLKNTLYHDFVSDMDEQFVKEHVFYVDDEVEGMDTNVVRILFKSKREWKDSGYLCIDTMKNVILRAKRSTGLEYNVKNRTNAFVRSAINVFYGHKYKDWQIDVEVEYRQLGNFFHQSSCRYANYMQEEYDSKKRKGKNIYNVTSIYEAQPYQDENMEDNEEWLLLPKPFAMKIIMNKKETRQENMLQNVNKKYHIYR